MADQISVPESGAGSGSSTATFGDVIQHIFAMPASGTIDTSAAGSDSGAEVVSRSQQPSRKKSPRDGSLVGSRSPARVSPRHGITSSTLSRSPSSRKTIPRSSTGDSQADSRGRPDARNTSGPASGFLGRPSSDKSSSVRRRSKLLSPVSTLVKEPSLGERHGFTPTRVDTPHLTPSFTPTRVDTPITLPRADASAGSSGAGPIPNGVPRGHHEGVPPSAPSGSSRGIEYQPTQLYSPLTTPHVAKRDHMEDSQAGKRPMEPSSLPLPSPARARTSSPRMKAQEPLSYLAEQVSPASRAAENPMFMI